MLQEHTVVNRHIDDPFFFINLALIAEYDGPMDVVKWGAQEHKTARNLKVKVKVGLRIFLPLIESPDLYGFTIVHDRILFIESDQQKIVAM